MATAKALLVNGATLGNKQDVPVHDRMEAVGSKNTLKLLKEFFARGKDDDYVLLHLENNMQVDLTKENGELKIAIWHEAFLTL